MVEPTDFKFSREKNINKKNDINVRKRNENNNKKRIIERFNTGFTPMENVQYYRMYSRELTDYPKDRERYIYKYRVNSYYPYSIHMHSKKNKNLAKSKGMNKGKGHHCYNLFSIGHNYINHIAKMDCKNSDFYIK